MKAEMVIHKEYEIGKIDPRIYGSFIEHLGRAVYSGIYEPGHETADDQGFRRDVMELVKKLHVPIVRYPGGNFVSGYQWEDGTGDKSRRPRRTECAWKTIETNEVGIDEFQEWAKRAGAEVMMAVNLGTRGAEDAKNLLEYCNLSCDSEYANRRKANGFKEPFHIKTWCLGNEMDGPWQIGHKTAEEYGRLAEETAKLMKLTDPSIELVACGSSNYDMPTFGEWEMTVLNHVYPHVDYISLHQYYGNPKDRYEDFMGLSVHMDRFIKSVSSICDAIKAKKHADKTMYLSFDEWNVWYHSNGEKFDDWQVAPPQLEDIYNFEDALLVGCMLMTLQNNCDRVKMACMAQLVNVIAPIMTEKGGRAWAQTIFYPYMYASLRGRGTVLKTITRCPEYEAERAQHVPYLESSVIHDRENRKITVFAVNRAKDEDLDVTFSFEKFGDCALKEHVQLYADDLKAVNTADHEAVAPRLLPVDAAPGAVQKITLKQHSWNMLTYEY